MSGDRGLSAVASFQVALPPCVFLTLFRKEVSQNTIKKCMTELKKIEVFPECFKIFERGQNARISGTAPPHDTLAKYEDSSVQKCVILAPSNAP